MIIKGIRAENFRNIKKAELEFRKGVNIFYGDNAQGKTNMLEALSVCLGKGFRRARPTAFAPFANNDGETSLTLFYEADAFPGKENTATYKIKDGRVSAEINNIPLKNAADLYGELKHVVFAPEHLALVKGAAELRRAFIDNTAIMQNRTHKRAVSDYALALKQLSALNNNNFASPYPRDSVRDMLGVWRDILIRQGINLTYGRLKYFGFLRETAKKLYSELTLGNEILDMVYKSNVFGEIEENLPDFSDKSGLYGIYADALNRVCINQGLRTPDSRIRAGAHRDDIIFTINNINAREFGSQGQVKSIALIMKLAEAEIIRNHNNETPVILLDEVLGELDGNRRDFIINRLENSQVFITSCDYKDFEDREDLRVWFVKDGEFHTSGG
ncbi:MAG: DNA replication and repair protein RecF [Oscillospiraceae bacterium]|nr:DNA replication and repair protein RecF [Oscillospiraceae bacterium]